MRAAGLRSTGGGRLLAGSLTFLLLAAVTSGFWALAAARVDLEPYWLAALPAAAFGATLGALQARDRMKSAPAWTLALAMLQPAFAEGWRADQSIRSVQALAAANRPAIEARGEYWPLWRTRMRESFRDRGWIALATLLVSAAAGYKACKLAAEARPPSERSP